jgi:Ras-related protein Rab-1A
MEWKELSFEGDSPSPRYKMGSCLVPERQGQARMIVFGGCDEEDVAMNDLYSLDLGTTTWSKPVTTGATPSPRLGHSVTLLPAVRKLVVIGGTDGKMVDQHSSADSEFPSHKTPKSFCPMTVHTLDLDTLAWSSVTCKNAGTGAEPSPRAYHSATLLGKNLFVTGGQVHHGLLAHTHYIHGAYILEIVKNQWEHNTIKGDSFIPYPGCSLLGHTACAIDSSSLIIYGGSLETTTGFDCVNTFWDVATDAKQKLHSSQLPKPTASGVYSTTFKLLVVGDAGVGKTCLITRFVDDVFSSTCKSTIGVDFKATSIEMDGKAVQLQVWDTAGQERFRALTTSYYRGAHGVILVYDVTEQASFDHLASWIKDVDLYSGEEVVKLLIGNKDDGDGPGTRPKVVDPDVAREFAKDHEMLFLEASALRATNVNAAFKLLVAEVMHQADTVASQPPAFEHKLKVNAERARRAQSGCGCMS